MKNSTLALLAVPTLAAALALTGCQGGGSSPSAAATNATASSPAATASTGATPSASTDGSAPSASVSPEFQPLTDAFGAMYQAMQTAGLTQSVSIYSEQGSTKSGVCAQSAQKARGTKADGVDMLTDTMVSSQPSDSPKTNCGGDPSAAWEEIVMGEDAWVTKDGETYKQAKLSEKAMEEMGATAWPSTPEAATAALVATGNLSKTGADSYTLKLTKPADLKATAEVTGNADGSQAAALDAITSIDGTYVYKLKDGKLDSIVADYSSGTGSQKARVKTVTAFSYAPVTVKKPAKVDQTGPAQINSMSDLAQFAAQD